MTAPSKLKESKLNQKELKAILDYDPHTGVFTWCSDNVMGVKRGSVAGSFDSEGYARIKIKRLIYASHRLACLYMTGNWPDGPMDHIDHVRSNNKWNNLRSVKNIDNYKNISLLDRNTSGFTGVSWDKANNKWIVIIKINSKSTTLGRFTDKFEAICCRASANNKHGFHANHGR